METVDHRRAALDDLARNLEVLASPVRLELLHVLRRARALHEIRVHPSRSLEGQRPERPMSRQAMTRHLEVLQAADLVRRVPNDEDSREGDKYLINHELLFALVDEVRNLTKLRPLSAAELDSLDTLEGRAAPEPLLPGGPRLLVAYGRDDGVTFALDGPPGASWAIGRAPTCPIRLDYDAYLSGTHAVVHRETAGFVLVDDGSRNGTWVNWSRLEARERRPLAPGDLITVGRSNLVFQP